MSTLGLVYYLHHKYLEHTFNFETFLQHMAACKDQSDTSRLSTINTRKASVEAVIRRNAICHCTQFSEKTKSLY